MCERCCDGKEPFTPKPDIKEWVNWKLTDESWQDWRDENPEEVKRMKGEYNE
jgi:predicted ribonuclease toxin of YeeF-YezG toxin-antitoxin module